MGALDRLAKEGVGKPRARKTDRGVSCSRELVLLQLLQRELVLLA